MASPSIVLQQGWLAEVSGDLQTAIRRELRWVRYRTGQTLLQRDRLPHQVMFIASGRVRVLADAPQSGPFTLARLGPGEAIGWVGLVRRIPSETVLAMEPTLVGALPAKVFLDLLQRFPALRDQCRSVDRTELAAVLLPWLQSQPFRLAEPERLLHLIWDQFRGGSIFDRQFPPGSSQAPADQIWLCSSSPDSSLRPGDELSGWPFSAGISSSEQALNTLLPRVLALPRAPIEAALLESRRGQQSIEAPEALWEQAEEAPDLEDPISPQDLGFSVQQLRLPPLQERGDSPLDSALVCLRRLASQYRFPFPRDSVRQVLLDCEQRLGGITLLHLGQVLENLGLEVRPLTAEGIEFHRIEPPALLQIQGRFILLESTGPQGVVLADPSRGLCRLAVSELRQLLPEATNLMLVRPADRPDEDARAAQFDLAWFWQATKAYRPQMLLVLFTGFVAKVLQLVFPLSVYQIIDVVIGGRNLSLLMPIALVLSVVIAAMAILGVLRQFLLADLSDRIDTRLGSQVVGHLFRLPLRFFDRRTVGDLSSRLGDLQKVRRFLTDTLPSSVLDLLFLPFVLLVLLLLQPVLGLVVLVQVPLLIALNVLGLRPAGRLLTRRNKAWAKAQSFLVEILTAIRTVKSQNFATQARWQWLDRYRLFAADDFRYMRQRVLVGEAGKVITNANRLALFCVAAWLAVDADISVGSIFVVFILSNQIVGPLVGLANVADQYREAKGSMQSLADILSQAPEESLESAGLLPLPPIRGQIDFERVGFSYGLDGRRQLDQFSLHVDEGSFVGLVGLSGSGKSTVVQMINGLYKPQAGRVFVDGVDVAKVQIGSLRRQVGYVPQESILFDGTIMDNLRLNVPDAPYEAVVEAATAAVAHDFIMSLPDGYNTRVGERGGGLSGGQKQRVAIARMVLQNPRMLILDEATSALDVSTEQLVLRRLLRRFSGHTLIMVTHRVATLKNADRILVMEQGSILEDGSWDQLVERGGALAALARQQMSASDGEASALAGTQGDEFVK